MADATGLAPMGDYGNNSMSIIRQIGLMIGLAGSVAFGVALVLWSQKADLRPMGPMDRATSYEVVSYLEQNEIDYEVSNSGMILVDQNAYQKVQMELASQGISESSAADSILKDGSGFGVSQQIENARLVRFKELNLRTTLEKFTGISSAQVHLAIPKETVFVSDKRHPSASVLLNVSSKMGLEREQIRSIVDLVASSIPNLRAKDITITDQYGRLHHSGSLTDEESQSRKQFEEENQRQEVLHRKIENMLSPILGVENFTVQVNVSMSFVANESTSKFYTNDQPILRSQRKMENNSSQTPNGGIPGSLSNQPPGAATIPEVIDPNAAQATVAASGNRHSETDSNYELDTTINHTRYQTAKIDRISVSVGLNNLLDPNDNTVRVTRNPLEIAQINRLIKGVINFNAGRGDVVVIDSFNFPIADKIPAPPPLEFYEEALFKLLLKPVVAFVGVLLLIFLVFKPMISKLTTATVTMMGGSDGNIGNSSVALPSGDLGGMQLPAPGKKSLAQVDRARSAVGDDPAMVAQVVKNWMESDE